MWLLGFHVPTRRIKEDSKSEFDRLVSRHFFRNPFRYDASSGSGLSEREKERERRRAGPLDPAFVEAGLELPTDDLLRLIWESDASGTGTDIVYTSGGASPFQQWGSPLSNFFSTASGPVDGSDWGLSNSDDGGQPVWTETETPASSYVAGQSEPYSIVLTTQDWIGTEQPLLTVATTNLVNPFGSSSQNVGNLAGSTFVSNDGATGTMDLIYWQASATPGDYAVEFQPITTTYVSGPSTGPSTVLTGGPTQLDAAVSQPLSWDLADNFTSNSAATEDLLGYSTQATATTEKIFLQGFSTSGVASTPVLAATIADGTWWALATARISARSRLIITPRPGRPELGYIIRPSIPPTGNWAAQPPSF